MQYERTGTYIINTMEPLLQSYRVKPTVIICWACCRSVDVCVLVALAEWLCNRKERTNSLLTIPNWHLLKRNCHGLFILLPLLLKSSSAAVVGKLLCYPDSWDFFALGCLRNKTIYEVWTMEIKYMVQCGDARGAWCWTLCSCFAASKCYGQRTAHTGIHLCLQLIKNRKCL